eukprot:gene5920-33492_t
MHPALIPERHPMCGKYMEAMIKCRERNPIRRYFGDCNDETWDLTKCLTIEKRETRAPRQAKFKEQFREKRKEDAERAEQLQAESEARKAAASEMNERED